MSEWEVSSIPGQFIKLTILIGLPYVSYRLLRKNLDKLEEEEFKKKYGSLYSNMFTLKTDAVSKMTTLFCTKRFILGLTTVFVNDFALLSLCVALFGTLFSVGFFMNNRPMTSKLQNRIEVLNESTLYLNCYFMFVFTDWVPNIEDRYSIGYFYIILIIVVCFINVAFVAKAIFQALRLKNKRRKWLKELNELKVKYTFRNLNYQNPDVQHANPNKEREDGSSSNAKV
jgi:hypothetical protein